MVSRNQNGGVFFPVIFAIVVLGGLFGVYYFSVSTSGNRSIASDPKLVMDEIREKVERSFANPNAINASIDRNPNQFACLFTVSADCTGKEGSFLLYESATSQPISQLVQGAGFGFDGVGCTGFPSEACPFRVETLWSPVCAPGRCENTKSFRLNAKVIYNAGNAPQIWHKEMVFTPNLKLSQATICERSGGVWALTQCLTQEQAAQRQIASSARGSGREAPRVGTQEVRAMEDRDRMENLTPPASGLEFICPETIVVQGQYYTLEQLPAGRGQVRTPAMNGCPDEDTFIFQCSAKNPASFEGEGQWIQVEAVMASNCDEQGRPIGPGLRN